MSLSTVDSDLPTLDDLENLFVNNADLDRLRGYLGRFNPIKTMGMERMEIRHSAILGWLLNPQETHGLGDAFLKAFLSQAFRGGHSAVSPSALDISQADLGDAEIRREWRHIDLLVLSQRNGWVFVIENKFDSIQHGTQLSRYMDIVHKTFIVTKAYKRARGVFLTLWEEEPDDASYAQIDYAAICGLLSQVAMSGRRPLTLEVATFLNHYLEVIKEAAGMSEEQKDMENLARQIYRDHRRVLDFIFDNGSYSDFELALETLFGTDIKPKSIVKCGKRELVFSGSDYQAFSFLPKTWFDAFGGTTRKWPGCETWWAGFPLIMWVQLTTASENTSGQIRLYAAVGPLSDYAFRKSLISEITEAAKRINTAKIAFQRGATEEGRKSSRFLKKNSLPIDDIQSYEEISNAIQRLISGFSAEMDIISEILPQFLDFGIEKPHEKQT